MTMLQNITIYYVFATLAPQRSTLDILGPTMSATPQFGVKVGPHMAPWAQYLEPDDGRQKMLPRAYNINKTTLSSHKVPRIMRAKAKKTPTCSASLIAIKLNKGLAAPGEALKNMKTMPVLPSEPDQQRDAPVIGVCLPLSLHQQQGSRLVMNRAT